MSWLCSQALVEACSEPICSDGAPSAPLSVMPTPHKFWRNDRTMEPSRLSQFGLTCAVLTADRGAALLTSYLAGFPAKTSASQDPGPDWQALVAGSGVNTSASCARFDPATSTLRTVQPSLLEDSSPSLPTLPRSGLMLGGVCYPLPPLMHPISVSGSGLQLWTTPSASDARRGGSITPAMSGSSLAQQINTPHLWPTPTVTGNNNRPKEGTARGTGLATAAKNWPTPTVADSQQAGGVQSILSGNRRMTLHQAVRWPTPTASLGTAGARSTERATSEGLNLIEAVAAQAFPTPAARDYRSPNAKSYKERGGGPKGEQLPNFVGGLLNPTWVEWLMGWPIGWTELKPLATAKFHEWQQQHGIC